MVNGKYKPDGIACYCYSGSLVNRLMQLIRKRPLAKRYYRITNLDKCTTELV